MAYAEKRGKYWRGRYKLPNGKYGSVSEDDDDNPFTTKNSAKKYAAGLETDVERKTFINPRDGRITVREWSEQWLESIYVDHLSERDYKSRLNAVILPEWGDVAVGDITTSGYLKWEKRLKREGRADNSIRGIRSVFRTMLTDAVIDKIRGDNPIPDRKSQRRGKYKAKQQQDERIFPSARQALLVAQNGLELRGFGLYVMVLTSFYTGLRIGELAGLQRGRLILPAERQAEGPPHLMGQGPFMCPDLNRWKQPPGGSRILLDVQSQYRDGKPALVSPKYASHRSLIIPPFLADLLKQLIGSHENEFVFLAPKGGRLLIGGDFYTDTWRPIVDGRAPRASMRGHKARPGIRPVLGVEGMTPHGLRHGHRVALDEAGHPRVAIEERMGHEVPGVEGTYSHTTLAMELKIAETLQSLWESSLTPPADGSPEWGPVPSPEATPPS